MKIEFILLGLLLLTFVASFLAVKFKLNLAKKDFQLSNLVLEFTNFKENSSNLQAKFQEDFSSLQKDFNLAQDENLKLSKENAIFKSKFEQISEFSSQNEEKFKNEMLKKESDFVNNLNEMKEDFANNIQELKENHKNELNKKELEYAKNLQELKENHSKDLQDLKAQNQARNEEITKQFNEKVELLSQKMLNLNSENLKKSSNELISSMLKNEILPLKDEILKYQKSNNDLNLIFSENFKNLKAETKNIMEEANKLTNALKGNKKTAGNWGEAQLEFILELSGLKKDINYFLQKSFIDKDGKTKFLDALVDFGEGKKAVIDSKCSLINYTNYANAKTKEEGDIYSKELAKDIKNHIDSLSSKEYKDYNIDTYDYIFMFIPNENMLYAGLHSNPGLYQYAYEKGIFLTTPLTLLMAMKTVYICWQNLKSDDNAREIMKRASALYDKIIGFLEDFERIEKRSADLLDSVENAKNKLCDGRGNVTRQLEMLLDLGASSNKQLPQSFEE